jgi:metal-responsive CopG/Arc/MetJ family transcriptional regulator
MVQKQERREFTDDEKAIFVANNTKIQFWMDKELIKKFDKIMKEKGIGRKDGIIKLIEKFVEKNHKGE